VSDLLSEAIRIVDLRELIRDYYPDAEVARIGERGGLIRAPYREDRHPSFSLYRGQNGTWLWKDHATGESGNAFTFLTRIVGLEKREAARELKRRAGLDFDLPEPSVVYEPSTEFLPYKRPGDRGDGATAEGEPRWELTARERALWKASRRNLKERYPDYLRDRAIPPKYAEALGLGITRDGRLVIPIRDPRGRVGVLKFRLPDASRGKYRYSKRVAKTPWLYLPGFQDRGRPVLVVEGEVNAIAAWAAVRDKLAVVGTAGAETPLDHPEAFAGRVVLVYADGDEAGERARARWSGELLAAGAARVAPLPPLRPGSGFDFGDYAGAQGLDALRDWILARAEGHGAI